MPRDAELLAIRFHTAFVFEPSGRIATTNAPDRSPAPRFALCGCASGNVYGVRADVADDVAAQLTGLAASEPPFVDQSGASRHLDRYVELLSRDALAPEPRLGMTYVLPNDIAYQHDAQLICSDSVEGTTTPRRLGDPGCTGWSRRDGIRRCLSVLGALVCRPATRRSGLSGVRRAPFRDWRGSRIGHVARAERPRLCGCGDSGMDTNADAAIARALLQHRPDKHRVTARGCSAGFAVAGRQSRTFLTPEEVRLLGRRHAHAIALRHALGELRNRRIPRLCERHRGLAPSVRYADLASAEGDPRVA
jgi:hypothetical protein